MSKSSFYFTNAKLGIFYEIHKELPHILYIFCDNVIKEQ